MANTSFGAAKRILRFAEVDFEVRDEVDDKMGIGFASVKGLGWILWYGCIFEFEREECRKVEGSAFVVLCRGYSRYLKHKAWEFKFLSCTISNEPTQQPQGAKGHLTTTNPLLLSIGHGQFIIWRWDGPAAHWTTRSLILQHPVTHTMIQPEDSTRCKGHQSYIQQHGSSNASLLPLWHRQGWLAPPSQFGMKCPHLRISMVYILDTFFSAHVA